MNLPQLEALHKETTDLCRETMVRKNHDYTDGSSDVFANFRDGEDMGVSAAKGLMLRVGDKMKRIKTFLNRGELMVRDETPLDSIHDIINYMILLKGLLKESSEQEQQYFDIVVSAASAPDVPENYRSTLPISPVE